MCDKTLFGYFAVFRLIIVIIIYTYLTWFPLQKNGKTMNIIEAKISEESITCTCSFINKKKFQDFSSQI